MFPFLRKGDLLTVEPVTMETIKRGDIVVFESEEKWIAHRVIKIRNSKEDLEFLLRGDTCMAFDPVVKKANYVGTVRVFKRRNLIKQVKEGQRGVWNSIISNCGLLYNIPLHASRISLTLIVCVLKKKQAHRF
jgi:signal peptidase I